MNQIEQSSEEVSQEQEGDLPEKAIIALTFGMRQHYFEIDKDRLKLLKKEAGDDKLYGNYLSKLIKEKGLEFVSEMFGLKEIPKP